MILSEISNLIIVDDLNNTFSENYLHFLSKPSSLLDLNNNRKVNVYTSKLIANLSGQYIEKNPAEHTFHILEPNIKTRIELTATSNDGSFFMVTLLETNPEDSAGKILLLFEDKNEKRVLYTGEFTAINRLSEEVYQLIENVDVLYLDNTLACNSETISIQEAYKMIQEVIEHYPEHNFILNMPMLGYEELIYHLTKIVTIFLNEARKCLFKDGVSSTQAINGQLEKCLGFCDENFSLNDTFRSFQEEKVIFIRFKQNLDKNFENVEKTGVHCVHWSPHPTSYYLFAFVHRIQPVKIMSIYSQFPEIPKTIQELCFKFNIEHPVPVNIEPMETFQEFNNNAEEEQDSSSDEDDIGCFRSDDEDDDQQPIESFILQRQSLSNSSSDDSVVTVIFSQSAFPNCQLPIAQSTLIFSESQNAQLPLTPIVQMNRKQNFAEKFKKKVGRNFPQTKTMENKGVNYLD